MAACTRASEIELPMSRQEIGDYLGLTITPPGASE